MKMIRAHQLVVLSLLGQFVAPCMSVAQQNIVVHHLKFGVSSGVPFNNDDADAIVAQMNLIMAGTNSAWSWDVKCSGVKFVRDGDVVASFGLSQNGDFDNLKVNLHKVDPADNVYIVTNLTCDGSPAAGCSDIANEPAVVTANWGLETDAIVWLHERGHDVGLQHAVDPPQGSEVHRVMYWDPDSTHTGKTADECQHFLAARFASVTLTGVGNMVANQQQPGQTSTGSPAAAAIPSSASADQAKALGLTLPAYTAISRPWLDKDTAEKAIAGLSDADVASIRDFLQKNSHGSSSLILQAMQVIGRRGTTADVTLLQQVLDRPQPAALPGPKTFEQREEVRRSLAEKNVATESLGDLANRTNSTEAVDALKNKVDLNEAATAAGQDGAISLSRSALKALSTTSQGAAFVQQVLDETKPASPVATEMHKSIDLGDNKIISAPPLTPTLRAQLQQNVGAAVNSP